ncbi:hypothetical protein GH714_028305 [Hevea brasiliensis]|uniref:Uncharacterized protein n=1 Tax=Hevea brasiliensis TaxID=3981 RepID=A0A6A6MFU8_HEVBR|nr:hypothetical protein GH714_028305 [Hevea brasiliensis]
MQIVTSMSYGHELSTGEVCKSVFLFPLLPTSLMFSWIEFIVASEFDFEIFYNFYGFRIGSQRKVPKCNILQVMGYIQGKIRMTFRTGFIASSSQVFGRGVLVEDSWEIAKRYLSSYFVIDILAVLPLPQYLPRVMRLYPLYKEVTRTSGMLTETASAGAGFNLFLYMLASHVNLIIRDNAAFLNAFCSVQTPKTTFFDFGIFLNALKSDVVASNDFPKKFFYCFWWGLRNLSSLGQNLKTSTFVWEICFAVVISISGGME